MLIVALVRLLAGTCDEFFQGSALERVMIVSQASFSS